MNKLLLFATSIFFLSLQSFSDGFELNGGANFKDSLIVFDPNDPKAGFRNLFESDATTTTIRLNPKAISFVQDYMDQQGSRLEKMKTWGKPLFDKIDAIFTSNNIPKEMKYLAVIESDLKTSATSHVGAAGPWQFMPVTGREMGLRVSRKLDERRDFNKSTVAAAKYLKRLYNQFGDWLLVIAAYNGGPGKVNTAIRKARSTNFWELQQYLPTESRNHVKKFIATHYIMEGEAGITTLTKQETKALQQASLANGTIDPTMPVLTISGKYNSMAIANVIGMNISEFSQMNPDFDRLLSASGKYELRLPQDKMEAFKANKNTILDQSIRLMISTVSR